MPGRTISAHADERTAAKVAEMARLEDRTPSQIAAAALRFYVELPAAGRDAIRALEASGNDEAIRGAVSNAVRALRAAQFEIASQRVADSIVLPFDLVDPDEDTILDAAVRLTTRRTP